MRHLAITILAIAGTAAAAERPLLNLSPAEAANPTIRREAEAYHERLFDWRDQREATAPANGRAADSLRAADQRRWPTLSAEEKVSTPRPMRDLWVVEPAVVISRDWQGAQALLSVDRGPAPWARLAGGFAVEQLDVRDAGGAFAIEALVRADMPVRILDSTTVGPAIAGRLGLSGHGLVAGWDASIHADHLIETGVSIIVDVGVSQRRDDTTASAVSPQAALGLSIAF